MKSCKKNITKTAIKYIQYLFVILKVYRLCSHSMYWPFVEADRISFSFSALKPADLPFSVRFRYWPKLVLVVSFQFIFPAETKFTFSAQSETAKHPNLPAELPR